MQRPGDLFYASSHDIYRGHLRRAVLTMWRAPMDCTDRNQDRDDQGQKQDESNCQSPGMGEHLLMCASIDYKG